MTEYRDRVVDAIETANVVQQVYDRLRAKSTVVEAMFREHGIEFSNQAVEDVVLGWSTYESLFDSSELIEMGRYYELYRVVAEAKCIADSQIRRAFQ